MWVKLRSYYWWTNLSSTNRSNARDEHIADYYVTPISDIELFLKSFQKVVPLNWNNSIIVDPTSGGNPKTDKDAYHPMSYPTAIKNIYGDYITTLKGLRKHSNADRLQCVEVFGQNVIVDLSYQEGQKVVFFPSDGQLSLEYATDNNLVRKKDENGNNIGGYMDAEKRNVTAIRLRGEKSEGLVLPIETLAKYTDISKLKECESDYSSWWSWDLSEIYSKRKESFKR